MYLKKDDNSSCSILTGDASILNQWEIIAATNLRESYLDIKLSSGESCLSGKLFSVNLQIQCDKQGKTGAISFLKINQFDPLACNNVILAKSLDACPSFNHYVLFTFLYKFFYVFGTLFILIGLFELILGKKVEIVSIFIIAFVSLCAIALFIVVRYLNGADMLWLWAVFGGGLVLAAPFGWLLYKFKLLFYLLIGAFTGFCFGLLIYNIFFNSIIVEHSVNNYSNLI